jgi:hypothetical protein
MAGTQLAGGPFADDVSGLVATPAFFAFGSREFVYVIIHMGRRNVYITG